MSLLPTQTQLMLPLLEALEEAGGSARPGSLYDSIAEKLKLSDNVRGMMNSNTAPKRFNLFERRVRWVRQSAVLHGLIDGSQRSVWQLTQKARSRLRNIIAGKVLHVFHTDSGCFLWGSAEDMVGYVERGSVQIIITSPPFPLNRPREYGNLAPDSWCDWMLRLCEVWRELLTDSGSLMLNLGPVWKPGVAAQSLYIERFLVRMEDVLGFHLLQRLDWASPSKLPVPLPWVGIARNRVTPAVEPIFWLGTNPMAYGNNRHVLRPYSKGGLRAIATAKERTTGPAGIKFGARSFVDCGGSIPQSLITAPAQGIDEIRYRKAVRAAGKVPHPAIMPAAVARFGIQLASEVGDIVMDPLCGSGTVAIEAMKLERFAIASDSSLEYLESAHIRCQVEGLDPSALAI